MTDSLDYIELQELQRLSLNDLQSLWELVPTERQRSYKAAYERELKAVGALGSDLLELQLIEALLVRYKEDALVPVGSRWARTPPRVQEAAKKNSVDASIESVVNKPSMKIVAGLGLGILIFGGFFLARLGGSSTTSINSTPTHTPSPTPAVSPTPTPLALEDQDEVIQGGDSARAIAYPVNLQVVTAGDTVPRVWVVQRRRVQASEWNFDPNPDTASFISGMSVRPIIGIPFSEENATFFDQITEGSQFTVTLNTGAILRYTLESRREVRRSDTAIFRQVSPGLVLLLMGETDEEGLPTATRPLILASYPAEQELSRDGEFIGQPQLLPTIVPTEVPTPTAISNPFAGLDVQVIEMFTLPGQHTTRLRLYNGSAASMRFTPDDVWLALGYVERPVGPRVPAEGMSVFELLPEQAADVTLVWLWSGEPYGALGVGGWKFQIQLLR